MKIALVGRPGGGKTTLFNAISSKQVPLLPGVPGAAPSVAVVQVVSAKIDRTRLIETSAESRFMKSLLKGIRVARGLRGDRTRA
ncbi:MAG: 50S ribosome-binding GTPase [Polyangiaceae bacterium]|nr:50S ribosome-binding GTPase [Polyangiaceae bacterium]